MIASRLSLSDQTGWVWVFHLDKGEAEALLDRLEQSGCLAWQLCYKPGHGFTVHYQSLRRPARSGGRPRLSRLGAPFRGN
jgi:hypothetical protein